MRESVSLEKVTEFIVDGALESAKSEGAAALRQNQQTRPRSNS